MGNGRNACSGACVAAIDGGRRCRSGRANNIVSSETDQKTFVENVGVLRGGGVFEDFVKKEEERAVRSEVNSLVHP